MFNILAKLEFIEAETPEELQKMLASIPLACQLKAIYGLNGKHIAWFLTDAKIVKPKPKVKPKGIPNVRT